MLVQTVDRYEDEDQTRTWRPVDGADDGSRQYDKVPGLSHAAVKEAQNFSVQ